MSSRVRNLFIAGLLGTVSMAIAAPALAGGFQLREQSSEGLGNAFAGSAAKAYNPSTIWYNPAGMMLLHGNQIAGSLTGIAPQARFSGTGSGGSSGGDAIMDAFVGANYAFWDFSPNVKFGVAVASPFGLRSSYNGAWTGRYQAIKSSITNINVNPNVAWRVNENLSLGAGIQIAYTEAFLSRATAIAPGLSGFSEMKGDAMGVGFNLGALWEFSPTSRIGASFRSQIANKLEGRMEVYDSAWNWRRGFDIHAGFAEPAMANVSFYHELTPQWAVLGGVDWTGWSSFEALTIKDSTEVVRSYTDESWRDGWFVSLGANYKINPAHTLHFGAAWDRSPIPDDHRTARVPDADRIWLSSGWTWEYDKHLTFNVGYAHLFAKEATINEAANATDAAAVGAQALVGTYKGSADILSTSFVYKF